MGGIRPEGAARERRVVFMATAAHMLTHAYMMIFPAVLVLVAEDPFLKVNEYFKLGIIGTVCYALFGIGAIPSGILADRYGSQRMLIICVFASALASLAAGCSFTPYLFVLSMGLLGLGASAYHPSGLSLISRNVKKKGRAMGLHGVGGNVGLALGPALSGAVATLWGWRSAFLVFGLFGLALGIMMLKLSVSDERVSSKAPQERRAEDTQSSTVPLVLLLIYINSCLYGLCYRGSMMYFPKNFAQNIHFALDDVAKAGFLVAMVTMAGTLGQLMGGILCDRLKRPETGYLVVFLFSTPLFFAISFLTDWSLFAFRLLFALFFFAWQPIQNMLVAKYTVEGAHGLSYGVNFLLIMGVGSLAASMGGYLTDHIGVSNVFAAMGMLSALSLVLVFYLMKAAISLETK
jgi:MFS family permease